MSIDATITLDRLECSKERDESGHSEPYIWPVLMQVDDNTLHGPGLLRVLSAPDAKARVVIKQDMKRGDAAPIPPGLRSFTFRFEDGLKINRVIVVVALLEADDTPERAVTQGYIAFRTALPVALGQLNRLVALSSPDPAEQAAVLQAITAEVNAAVRKAIGDSLSGFEKLRVLLGLLDLDDDIAVAHTSFDRLLGDAGAVLDQPFTMRLQRRTGQSASTVTDLYQLQGRFQTRPVVRDRCQPLATKARDAQDEVDSIHREIAELKVEHRGEPELPQLVAEIEADELAPAEAALAAALRDLAKCRAGGLLGGTVGTVDGGVAL
jgi:hypothetical protein